METVNQVLIITLETLVEEWRCALNAVYGRREDEQDEVVVGALTREIERRIRSIRTLETAIAVLKTSK